MGITTKVEAGSEVARLGEQLKKSSKDPDGVERSLDLLKQLGRVDMTVEMLKQTGVGRTVGKLARKGAPALAKKAKPLVDKWKKLAGVTPIRASSRKRKKVSYNEDAMAKEFEIKEKKLAPSGRRIGITATGKQCKPAPEAEVLPNYESLPKRNKKTGELKFADRDDFYPNLTPAEVLQRGSFGGTYFRPIYSGVTGVKYGRDVWKEFPKEWFEGLSIKHQVTCKTYNKTVNRYKVKCGGDLDMWETSGWISPIDPYGWFQWYCRFYLGRRSTDDDRQISRWKGVCSKKGRFRNQLIGKVWRGDAAYDSVKISPVIRQALQHWGYVLTEKDYIEYCRLKGWKN